MNSHSFYYARSFKIYFVRLPEKEKKEMMRNNFPQGNTRTFLEPTDMNLKPTDSPEQ